MDNYLSINGALLAPVLPLFRLAAYCDVWFWGALVNIIHSLTALHASLMMKFIVYVTKSTEHISHSRKTDKM